MVSNKLPVSSNTPSEGENLGDQSSIEFENCRVCGERITDEIGHECATEAALEERDRAVRMDTAKLAVIIAKEEEILFGPEDYNRGSKGRGCGASPRVRIGGSVKPKLLCSGSMYPLGSVYYKKERRGRRVVCPVCDKEYAAVFRSLGQRGSGCGYENYVPNHAASKDSEYLEAGVSLGYAMRCQREAGK